MFPIPRNKENPSEATTNMKEVIRAIITIQGDILETASSGIPLKQEELEGLRGTFLYALQNLFSLYREASRLMQLQEGLDVIDNYPFPDWSKRMKDLEHHLDEHPEVLWHIVYFTAERINLVKNQTVPIITPEDIHAAIAEAMVAYAGELYPKGYIWDDEQI